MIYVDSMKINSHGRVDADVVVNSVRMHTILLRQDPLIDKALQDLYRAVIEATKKDLSDQLGLPLGPVTDSSST